MKTRLLAVAALLAPAAGLASPALSKTGPDGLDLVCATEGRLADSYRWDPVAKRYRPTADDPAARTDFESALVLHLETDAGAIQPPASLLTGPYTGDDKGWWTLEQLKQGPAEIRGRYRLTSTRRPEIVIARADGRFRLTDEDRQVEGRCVQVSGRAESGL
jgi:hypothetical protein